MRQAYRQLGSRRLCLPWLPWYPEALTTELIRAELRKEGVEAVRFQLMSIDEFEWLLTWAQHEHPAVVLRDKLSERFGRR